MTDSRGQTPASRSRPALLFRFPFLGIIAALLVIFSVTAYLAWDRKSATYDEPLHLVSAWVQVHEFDFRDDPDSSSIWKYYLATATSADDLRIDKQSPLWPRLLTEPRTQYLYSQILYTESGVDAASLISDGRARMIALGALLGALIAWWAWRLAGPLAACVSAAAFCLDPNFLAHAPLIKNDAPIALVFFALAAAIWLVGERADFRRILIACLMLEWR